MTYIDTLRAERAELLDRFAQGRSRLTNAAVTGEGGRTGDDALRLRWLNEEIEKRARREAELAARGRGMVGKFGR